MKFLKLRYIPLIDELAYLLFYRSMKFHHRNNLKKAKGIPQTVPMGRFCYVDENTFIGEGSYCGEYCHFYSGKNSRVVVGNYCAIGSNVKIKARTHDIRKTTPDENGANLVKEESIQIGSHVWIGDNVFIREGVTIGDYAIVGANSVVTRNVGSYEVWGGVPAIKISSLVVD